MKNFPYFHFAYVLVVPGCIVLVLLSTTKKHSYLLSTFSVCHSVLYLGWLSQHQSFCLVTVRLSSKLHNQLSLQQQPHQQ